MTTQFARQIATSKISKSTKNGLVHEAVVYTALSIMHQRCLELEKELKDSNEKYKLLKVKYEQD